MEVAPGRSGGGPVRAGHDDAAPSSRVRFNVGLYVGVVLLVGLAVVVGAIGRSQYLDSSGSIRSGGFWDRTWALVTDERTTPSDTAAGEKIGDATVVALPRAPEDEQQRNADVLEAATKMANAFLNVNHEDIEASIAAVSSLATGEFKNQYEKSAESITKVAKRAQSVQTGEVLWAGLVASDDDSATVIIASAGSVTNKTTDFEPVARNYRLQIDLVLEDGRWLTRDLQFVP